MYNPPFYNNAYAYPRRLYPYGYGAFGLGYFYYDPYAWYPSASVYGGYGHYPGRPGGYGGRTYGGRYAYDIGALRLDVRGPKDAQVFVDGYYAGTLNDFDGTFQSLDLESGAYRIEIVAQGFETLDFDIRIQPGRKITYRGDLRRTP